MSGIISKPVDIAVIGGGPGGIGAAIRAREEGAERVVLLERSEELGGMLTQCIHNGFGLHYFKEELSGPAYIYKQLKKLETSGVEVMTRTMAIELAGTKIKALAENAVVNIEAKAVILCMGCRERARGSIRIPGHRPAGVFTAGTAQRLINIDGYLPGKKVVILGSGDIGMIMARRLTLEGAEVVCLVELLPFIGGLIRNEVQCLQDFNIPVYTSHTVSNIIGKDRVEKIVITEVDRQNRPVPGTEKEFEADTLLLSIGLIPENELSSMAGVELNLLTGGSVVDNLWQTSVAGIFAGGNVVHVHDLADYVTESAEMAASNAVRRIEGRLKTEKNVPVRAGQNIRYVVPNRIVSNDPVSFYLRVSWPLEEATVHIGGLYRKKFPFVRPSEQIRIDVPAEKLKNTGEEIVVSCEGKEAVAR
ncbi:MAG: FAD-dependent oxidoreductase [Peptococcaceae bacterium]|jgi:NADPH-dependent 2,4-dienoyl-CoA reductase/sulfur reductase-like enzyme|nr:FAD-dependent oxidoreductase [Peptococcaceae bacterium]MDH7524866.1 FAD-dependent oxidoreductase [Peptococcaceae bacterium]